MWVWMYGCVDVWVCGCVGMGGWWCGRDVTAMTRSILLHGHAPNKGGRTPGSQTPGVPATWASTSGWTEAENAALLQQTSHSDAYDGTVYD